MVRRLLAVVVMTIGSLIALVPGAPPASADYDHANRVYLLGDSTLAALRWSGTAPMLAPYDYVLDAESCRRITGQSCRGREGFVPSNGLDAMHAHDGQLGDTIVAMIGYDDSGAVFGAEVDQLIAEAKRQGVKRVIWLTFKTDVSYVGPTFASDDTTYKSNNRILNDKLTQYAGYLILADWNGVGHQHPDWFATDGVHLSLAGATGLANFIHGTLDQLVGSHCGQSSPALGEAASATAAPADTAPAGVVLTAPRRLIDTRDTGKPVGTGLALRVPLKGVVPADATSVIVNITGTNPCNGAFLSAFGCNQVAPKTSNVNLDVGTTRATSAIVPISGGDLCILAQQRTDVIVDLFGYTSPSAPTSLVPAPPRRLIDTRDGSGTDNHKGALKPGETLQVSTSALKETELPAIATGLVVNATAVSSGASGWLAVFPCGQEPTTSVTNFDGREAVANAVAVTLDASRAVCVRSNVSVDVVLDLDGWIVPSGVDRHVAKPPTRLVDTRESKGGTRLAAGGVLRVPVGANPSPVGAVLSVTMVGSATASWVAVYPCDKPAPVASNVNTSGTETRANLVLTALSASGEACVLASKATDVVIDLFGLVRTST